MPIKKRDPIEPFKIKLYFSNLRLTPIKQTIMTYSLQGLISHLRISKAIENLPAYLQSFIFNFKLLLS